MFGYMYIWWFWVVLMFVFLLPVGYGWAYRGWGAPYPSYLQRRRMERAALSGDTSTGHSYLAWGRGGDFVWLLLVVEIAFVAAVFFWR